jgi:glycine dehydrogenase subunit 1
MSYLSLSERDRKEMLERIGVSSVDDLFCCIPEAIHLKKDLDLPGPLSEMELAAEIQAIADRNAPAGTLSFMGGGAYAHFIPSVVDYLSSRGEFVSPYTPYQPEVSQGTLQVIFEFQTLICQLTGLDIANASLYEGATAAAEAVLMAQRVTGKAKVLIAASLHPQYREVIRTYVRNLNMTVEEIPFTERGTVDAAALDKALDDGTAAVLFQSPNYFGVCEDVHSISTAAKTKGALSVAMVAEALSLALLEAPGKLGADIVAGEAQSFGIPLSFGGPYLGFMAARKEYLRQLPGRICGQTTDVEGQRGFVLTLSTREQHIRREKATSNICTNQALCALRATIYLAAMGREGLRRAARHNVAKTAYALEKLLAVRGVERRFSGPVFNEFVIQLSKPWLDVDKALRKKGIRGGIGLDKAGPGFEHCVLVCVTELHAGEDIDRLAAGLEEVLR